MSEELLTQYTDILLACTRHLLDDLQQEANPGPLVNWLRSRWQSLKDLALTEVEFDTLSLQQQIGQFTTLTATLRRVPTTRKTIREQVDIHSISLIDALNEFIAEAQRNPAARELVVIADNLDRIGLIRQEDGKTNHDEIFIDYSSQMCRLACNVIYTVPISLVYSNRIAQLRDSYGDIHVLPMVMVQTALNWTDELPIRRQAMLRAVAKGREDYRNAVDEVDWAKLAEVAQTKRIRSKASAEPFRCCKAFISTGTGCAVTALKKSSLSSTQFSQSVGCSARLWCHHVIPLGAI